ncbi:MAG: hypothetical protein J0J12_01515 [Bosea sp.]|nr:hypothetical protein [Bosea sp. (in: a-proteobacteria)]
MLAEVNQNDPISDFSSDSLVEEQHQTREEPLSCSDRRAIPSSLMEAREDLDRLALRASLDHVGMGGWRIHGAPPWVPRSSACQDARFSTETEIPFTDAAETIVSQCSPGM